jgi:hypothetical protein
VSVQPNPASLPAVPEGTGACGGCDGVQGATPQPAHNRGGLDAVAVRVGTWAQFRASLHAGLSDSRLAPLNALLTRDSSDFSIALIDAFACAADVLTFHSERIAQESYLGTATERVSLQEMGQLIGYRLRPGVAAEAALAFSVETPPQPPAALAPEPGVFVHGVPAEVPIGIGFKVQSLPGPGEKPQVFETVEALQARPGWNAMRARADADVVPGFGARGTWLAGTATQLKAGDLIVLAGPEFEADAQSNRWDARVLTQVQPDHDAGRTFVAWAEPLGSVLPPMGAATPPTVYALRERVGIFGHNAPDWSALSDEYKAGYLGKAVRQLTPADRLEWPHFNIHAPQGTIADAARGLAVVGAADAASALREVLRSSLAQQQGQATLAERLLAAGTAAGVGTLASRSLRGGAADALESAIAGAAASAVAARLEAELALQPHLPEASGASLTQAIVALEDELLEALPDGIATQAFAGDARALPVLLNLLADDDALQALDADGDADGGNANANRSAIDTSPALARLASGFAGELRQRQAQGGAGAARWLADVAGGQALLQQPLGDAGQAVLAGSVQRVRTAARQGAASVFSRVRQLALQLQAGRLGRAFPGRDTRTVSLEREVSGAVPGSLVLLDAAGARELYKVQAAGSTSRSEFAVQSKSSTLQLAGQGLAGYALQVRQTAVFTRSEALARARTPDPSDVAGDRLAVAAHVGGLPVGRRLLIQGTRRDNGQRLVHAATLVSATPAARAADGGELVFKPSLPAPLLRSSVVVFGNVALASHGETVAQVLGSGNAAEAHQRFALLHAPLTHRAAASESGARAELEVRVGDVAWSERSTLFGAGPQDRVFSTRTDEQGQVWLQFGDGLNGARLPSATHNLRARYRKGLGREGNVGADALSQALARPLGFKGVSNPAPAGGGTDAEPADAARRSMPLGTRTLGRVVSLLDHEDFARAFAGIAKAQARSLRLPAAAQGAVVAITIAAAGGAPIDAANPVWANLLAALQASGDPRVQRRLLAARQRSYRVGLKVRVDAAYEAATVLAGVEVALRAQGAFDARELGQPLHASQVVAAAHAVPGVLAVDLDFLFFAGSLPALRPTLQAAATRLVGAQLQPAELLVLDAGPLVRLETLP